MSAAVKSVRELSETSLVEYSAIALSEHIADFVKFYDDM
jgi:hypothetical protein